MHSREVEILDIFNGTYRRPPLNDKYYLPFLAIADQMLKLAFTVHFKYTFAMKCSATRNDNGKYSKCKSTSTLR